MRAHQTAGLVILLAASVASVRCDAVDRARSRFGKTTTDTIVTATGSGLALGLQAPPTLHPGDEGVVRLSLTNQTDTAVSHVQLQLILPGWAEPMPPRIGDSPVSMAAMEDGSTLFTYRIDDVALASKRMQTVEQRIRVPASGVAKQGPAAWTRVVRARLLTSDGRPLAEVQTEVAIDSAAIAATRLPAMMDTTAGRDRLGPIELGMTAGAVKQAAPDARDTAWSQSGVRQRGLLVPVANGTALAVLSGDAVERIEVAHISIRNAERLGVGSRMDELRAAYGPACADAIAGRVVAWFARAPGISFALNTPVPQNPAQLRNNPDLIPGNAQVTRWWLSRGGNSCSAGGD